MSTTNTAMKSACLSVGLVSAWAPIAGADVLTEVRFECSMSAPVTHARVMLGGLGSGSPGGGGVMLSGVSLPGVGSEFILSSLASSAFGDSFAMVGLTGDGSGALHAVVSMGGLTYLDFASFEQVFPGFSEALLIDQLLTNNPAADNFLRTNFALLLTQQGQSSPCASFSGATPFGSITISAVSVPAPASCALLSLGVLVARRRRS